MNSYIIYIYEFIYILERERERERERDCARSLLLCKDFLQLWHVRATLVAVCRLLIAVASLVAEHGLLVHGSVIAAGGLGGCGSQA